MTEPANLNNLLSVSETVVGLILLGKQTSTNFSADKFAGKYQNVIKDLQAGKTEEDLYIKYSNLIQPAKYAAKSVNGMGEELNWVDVVNKAYCNEVVVESLNKTIKYFTMGDTDKAGELLRRATATLGSSQKMRSMAADEIEDGYTPFLKSGTASWDKHFGGLPNVGLVILAAQWGEGKTTTAIKMMANFLREYPEREILFVTLEDMAGGWKERAETILGKNHRNFWHRVKVMEFAGSSEEIIQEASRYPDLGMIYLDYIDYMVKSKDLASYDEAYKSLSMGAKTLAVASKFQSMPIVALAQFNRGNNQGGVPTPAALMFTGEQYTYQLVMLYNPNTDFHSDNAQNPYVLPSERGYGYVVAWKIKNGCRPHLPPQVKEVEFPGAIKVPLSISGGFNLDVEGTWFSLAGDTKRETKPRK